MCLVVCLFFQGWSCLPRDSIISREGSFERKLKVTVPFLSDQKNWSATRPPTTPLISQKILENPKVKFKQLIGVADHLTAHEITAFSSASGCYVHFLEEDSQLERFAPDDKSWIANKFGCFFANIGIKAKNNIKNRYQQVQEYIICDSGGESFELAFDRGTSDELLKLQLKG